jgi:3-methyl-2-oxobutanoate hydroxymethyltransferase
MPNERFSAASMLACKQQGRKFTMLSIYDYPTARIATEAGIDSILVGDSLAMTVLGQRDTIAVTMDEMLHHVKAVARGAGRSMVVADMPFLSYQTSPRDAVFNAGRFMKEGLADAVKVEGGAAVAPILAAINRAGIPVIAHIGLTPQSAGQLGGLKVQAKTSETAMRLLKDALQLEEAGACAILMECVPAEVARLVSERLVVPTISYGAGPHCDGQGLVSSDVLGLFDEFKPKFSKRYCELGLEIKRAFAAYRSEVLAGTFPDTAHTYGVNNDVLAELSRKLVDGMNPKK